MTNTNDPKTSMMLNVIGALLSLHQHETKHLARLHRQFGTTFHEELALPPARPISKRSRARHKASDLAATPAPSVKFTPATMARLRKVVERKPAPGFRDLAAEQRTHL